MRRATGQHKVQNMERCSASERADIVSPARLQGFSDAVFATAATLLVIPIRKFKLKEHESLKNALIDRFPELMVFVVGFLVICTIWESHILRFKVIARIDDLIVVLTLVSLMFTTFLPFTVALEGKFGKYPVAITLPCVILLILEAIEFIMFLYAFHAPRLLSSSLRSLSKEELRVKKAQIFGKIAINCTLFILAAGFSSLDVIVSWVMIVAVIFTPLIRRLFAICTKRFCCPRTEARSRVQLLTGRIEKERIEYFSDAAIAIVATLLVLDITTEDFPGKSAVKKDGLWKTLVNMWQMFVAYMGCYATVALLWFVHHSVLHQIRMLTAAMTICNNLFLACLAGTPFVSTLVNKYTGHVSHNEKIAVRVSCVIVFGAGFMQFLIFVLAFWNRDQMMHNWAIPGEDRGHRTHIYLLLKTLIIPCMTFLTFCVTLSTDSVTYTVYHISLFLVPVFFVLLKIAFACHCHQSSSGEDPSSVENSIEHRGSTDTMQPERGASFFDDAPEAVLLSPKTEDTNDLKDPLD